MALRLRDGDSINLQTSGNEYLSAMSSSQALNTLYSPPTKEAEFLVLVRNGEDMISLFTSCNRYVGLDILGGPPPDKYHPWLIDYHLSDRTDFQYIRNSNGTISFFNHHANVYIAIQNSVGVCLSSNSADAQFKPLLVRGPDGETTFEDD